MCMDHPHPCKDFRTIWRNSALAVVYPALSCGRTAAGPDGFRGSTARQMDELKWLASFH